MKIRLLTLDGEFVADKMIPPFRWRPDVIVWGDRTFHESGFDGGFTLYREVFAYCVVDFPEAKELPNEG